jgi:hypothetical protein
VLASGADGGGLHAAEFKAEGVDDVLLLGWGLADPEQAGLRIMVGKFFRAAAYFVFGNGLGEAGEALHAGLEWAAATQRIWLVGDTATRDGLAVHAIALVVVHGLERGVNGQLVKVDATEAADLRIQIGVDAALQQGVVGEINAGDDVRGAKSHLLGFGKEVVGVAAEHHLADGGDGHHFFGDELGGV